MDRETIDFLDDLEQGKIGGPAIDNQTIVPAGERECPICKTKMHVENDLGISIDVCEEHGIWLDRGELPAMLARVRSGDRISRREAIRRAKRDGKVSGSLFGLWSLWLN